jgi:hypothetical protein
MGCCRQHVLSQIQSDVYRTTCIAISRRTHEPVNMTEMLKINKPHAMLSHWHDTEF